MTSGYIISGFTKQNVEIVITDNGPITAKGHLQQGISVPMVHTQLAKLN